MHDDPGAWIDARGEVFYGDGGWLAEVESYGVYEEKGFELWAESAYEAGLSPEAFVELYLAAQEDGFSSDPYGMFAYMLEELDLRDEDADDPVGEGDTGEVS